MSNVLELPRGWIENLYVRSQIPFAIHLCKLIEVFIGDLGDVELVVANGQDIIVNVLKYWIGKKAIWARGIAQTSAIMKVLELLQLALLLISCSRIEQDLLRYLQAADPPREIGPSAS
jgi:hypothetical protein